jgi:hypothetical protein
MILNTPKLFNKVASHILIWVEVYNVPLIMSHLLLSHLGYIPQSLKSNHCDLKFTIDFPITLNIIVFFPYKKTM